MNSGPVVCLVFLVALVISGIVFVGAGFVAQAFFQGLTNIVRVCGLIVLVWALNIVFLNFFRAFRQMVKFAIFNIASTYGQIGLITYLVLHGQGIFSMVLSIFIINSLILLCSFFLVYRQIGIRKPSFSRIKEYLNFGLPTVPGNISAWIVYSSDRLVIAHFLGSSSVGIYSAAYSLGSLPDIILSIFGLVLPPTLSILYDEGKIHELKIHLSYSLKYCLLLVIPFVFGSALLAIPVLKLFTTPEIASEGYKILIIESINSLVMISGGVVNMILVPVKKTRISGIVWLIAAAVNLGLNLILVPMVGIMGAIISTLICFLLAESIQAYYSLREIKIAVDWVSIIKFITSAILMSAVIWFMHPANSVMTIITIAVGISVYFAALFLLRAFSKEEIAFFMKLGHQIIVPKSSSSKSNTN